MFYAMYTRGFAFEVLSSCVCTRVARNESSTKAREMRRRESLAALGSERTDCRWPDRPFLLAGARGENGASRNRHSLSSNNAEDARWYPERGTP